ncbi:MAG: winged helix-turn-helix domain-containing protein [Alphaproteobacteria bacterium]
MDQIIPRTLSFDRFELDLMRGCARVAGRDLELRPKAFQLLCYLAENVGRLVSKQELHDAIWPRVTVSDDALVQCVRELRQKLRDGDRTVIQTVPRRGYLLNATKDVPDVALAAAPPPPQAPATPTLLRPWYLGGPVRWAVAAIVVLALALASSPAGRWAPAPPRDLLSVADVRHLAKLAAEKELPLPAFHITSLAEDVPDAIRRFVGVWVSDTGWMYSDRQLMVIITNVTKGGHASGYFVNGPTKPYSRMQGPAFSMNFKGYINAGTLRYDGYVGMYLADLDREGIMEFKLIFQDGVTTKAKLKQIWTLPKSGRTESAGRGDPSTRL